MAFSYRFKIIVAINALLISFVPTPILHATNYGSDTAVSIVNPFNITGPDNIIKTFGCAKNGFAFVDSTVSCSFNSVYSIAGPVYLRGGKLYLMSDLILTNTGSLADLGTIIGQDHAVELSEGSNTFASITNPNGARSIALVARRTATRSIYSLDWSYDNQYIATVITSGSGSELFVYSFNGTTLTQRASVNLSGNGTSVRWRPNSYYLAAASDYTSGKIRVYLFNPTTNTLTLKSTQNPTGSNFRAVAWQGRGTHLAVAGSALYVYRFNAGTETLDTLYTPTNNAVLNGSITYDCLHWAPVGNKNDFIAGTTGGSLHLYNFDGSAVNHLKRYNPGTAVESLDWAPTSTYMALGFTNGSIQTYQHTASINNITPKTTTSMATTAVNAVSWKPNATELTAGVNSSSGYDHQFFSFNTTSYVLTNVYNIEVGNAVFFVKYSNTDGTYIARADGTTRYLSVYKESYSPFLFKDVHLFLNSNLTIGTPLTFIGDCTINGRGNGMTFTGDGTINIATNSFLDISNSNLSFERPNAFALQGKTSQLSFSDTKIGLDSNIVFGDGSWEAYNDVSVTGPYTFAYSTANTSTIHTNAYLTFGNGATFEIGKTAGGGQGASSLEFESNAAHLVLDNATLHVTNSGLSITKGIVDVYGSSAFVIDYTDTTLSNTTQALTFGDGITGANDALLILHGNGTNLTISNGSIILDPYTTRTMTQFEGQPQLSIISTASLYIKRPIELTNGWLRPTIDTAFYIDPAAYLTVNNTRFDYQDIFADYVVTGTIINTGHTLLDSNNYIFVNRGNSIENLSIVGQGAIISGVGGPLGTITLYDANTSLIWDAAGTIGLSSIYLNGGKIAITKDVQATPGFSFSGTGTVDIDAQTFAMGAADTEWNGNIYWAGNGGTLKLNSNVALSGIWTLSGQILIDGQGYTIDLGSTGTLILERGAKVEFANMSVYNLSRQTPIVCSDNNCEVKINFSDVILSGDYLFDTGSLYIYYDSTLGSVNNLDGIYTFTYASTMTSTIEAECYFEIWPHTRFSIGRHDSTITDPEQQPLVFLDPVTSRLILNGGTLHITSSGMLLTKGTLRVENTSNLEIDTPKYEYGFVLGDGTLENDCVLLLDPGVQLNIKTGAMYYQNNNPNRIIFGSPASALNIQSPGGFVAKTGVTLTDGWFRPRVTTPFSIDPTAYITANNLRLDHTDILSDYNVTGTFIDPLNIILGTNDSIAVTRGNSIENLSIVGQGALLSGVGGPLGTITLQDATASLTWDVANTIGINTITLNGGRIALTQNAAAIPGFTLQGTGTVNIGNQSLELGTEATEWNSNIYWISNGGSLKINNNVTLSGIWTFSGNILVDGQDYLIDFDPTGTLILERGAHVTFSHMSLYNLSRKNRIVCKDNNCEIKLIIADMLLAGDYLFDKGSLYVYYNSTVGTVDGLDHGFTFTYASTQTSTIDSFCYFKVLANTRFSIGRQDSTKTDPEQQPLIFNDPLTSKLILDGGTLHVTSSGMRLTKGTLEIQDTSDIEVDTPIYEYGLVLGDGTLANDFALIIDPGVQLNIKQGRIFYQNNQDNRITFASPASSLSVQSPVGFVAKTGVTFTDGWFRPRVATPFSIDPAAYITANNLRIDRSDILSDYSVTGTLIDPLHITLGPNDSIAVTRGNSIENLSIVGQGALLSGVGGPLGTITLQDATASLTWDIANTIGISAIALNGGRIALTQNVIAAPGFTLQGTGTVNIGNQSLELGTEAAEWNSNIYWISDGGSLKLNSDATLSGIWTFSGTIVMDGQGSVIDLGQTGTIILERGAQFELRNTSVNNLSQRTPIVCSDNNCVITLNFVSLLLSSDYLFDKGGIYLYYDSAFGILDGLDGTYTFTYASTQTCTIESEANLEIWPNTRFSIGRQNSTITDPEQQPLVFLDPLTSKVLLRGGTLHVTSSGMMLTKGTLEINRSSSIEIDTPKYPYGLILGDGTLANDFDLVIDAGCDLNLKTGSIFYQNNQNNRLVFGSPASSLTIESPTGFRAKTDMTFHDGTIITENPSDIGVVPDDGVTAISENVTKISRGSVYSLKKLTVHGGLHPYKLLNGDLYQIVEGYTTDDVIATQGSSYFAGSAGFGGSLSLKDHTVTLQSAYTPPLLCDIALNGGTLMFTADGAFAADNTITGSGKVQLLGTKVSFGPAETAMTSTLYWQGLTSGDICLNAKTSLSSTWTLGGLMHINGNGNIFDVSNRGVLTIRPGATLALENIAIKGLGSGKGNINFMSDTSTLKLSNAYLELDNNFSTTIGGIIVNGPTIVGLKNYNWLLDQKASMTVDGVTLWQDPLDQTTHGRITFGAGPRSKYLSLVSSGTIKTATNLDLVTSSTDDLETQIRANSNALLYCCRTTSNALLFGDRTNSNAIIKLANESDELARTTSNALLYCCKNTSNALLFGDRTNSNAIIRLDRTVRTDSSAFARSIRNNSNAIILLSNETDDLSRTTSNALLYCCRTTSNALLLGDRTNSNAIIRLDRTVRTDSNAFARGIRNNSNAIRRLSSEVTVISNDLDELQDLVNNNSNAIIKLDRNVRTNSNALLLGDRVNSNAQLYCCRNSSNAIIRLDRTVRTDSNAFARGIRNNSNAILKLAFTTSNLVINNSNAIIKLDRAVRTNSNALLYCCRTTSNAIIRLDRTVRTDSNAFARGIRNNSNAILKLAFTTSNLVINNSNAIVKLDVTTRTNSNAQLYCCRTTSNALLFGDRVNSNAIIRLDRTVRTDSNAFARGIRNNSNAILKLASTTSNLVINNSNAIVKLDVTTRTNSNAQLYCCRNSSNALLFGDRINSNAIIRLDRTVRTDSNAFARGIRNNSNAILKLASTTSNLVINNSNAIVKLDVTIRTNSNAQLYCCRTTSNALLFGNRVNSNAIIRLDRTIRTDSNAFARGIRNNSNAIIQLASEGSDLVRATSNALLYCCRTTSNALLFGDRNNSNAILSITVTTSNQFVINNSNAIGWLNTQLQTIDHGPTNITINTSSYQLSHDVFISLDHRMYIQNSTVINGHGHSINLACPANGAIDIAAGSTVIFHHVAFRNYTDAIFNLGAGASVIFGDGVHLELLQAQTLERQWTFTGSSVICGNGNELAVDPYAIVVAPHSKLNIHGVALTGLKNTNLSCAGNTASLTLSEVGIYLDNNFNFTTGAILFDPDVVIVGTNTFVYSSDMTSSIARNSQLYMSGITFSYAPPSNNRDLFAMVDQSSRFFIDGCTLMSTTTGMRLTRGTLIADHKNFLDNTGGESLSEGFAFGDGNPAHDLSIEVKPGGSLNLVAGYWDYVNV